MQERWADIAGWPGYKVSDQGVVIGPRGKPLKGYIDRYGYPSVGLWNCGVTKAYGVHRLVIAAFIGEIPKGKQGNHRNGIKADNRLCNLEVVTASENVIHSFRVLGRVGGNANPVKGSEHPNSKLNEEKVREIRTLYSQGWTQVRLAEKFQTPQTNISMIILNKAWKHVSN